MARYITQEPFSSQKQSLEVFYKKGALDKFAKFTGKKLVPETLAQVFPLNFGKFLRTLFTQNT